MVKVEGVQGVWRTIGGRRVFIKDGQDLATAMKESGKFKKAKDIEHQKRKIANDIEKNVYSDKERKEKWKEYDAYNEIDKEYIKKVSDAKNNDELKKADEEKIKRLEKIIEEDQKTGKVENRMKSIESQQRYDRLYNKYKEQGMTDEKIKDMLGERPKTGLEDIKNEMWENNSETYITKQGYDKLVARENEKYDKALKKYNESQRQYKSDGEIISETDLKEEYRNELKRGNIEKDTTYNEWKKGVVNDKNSNVREISGNDYLSKAYQKYLKEHPGSKMTFEDFKNMNK